MFFRGFFIDLKDRGLGLGAGDWSSGNGEGGTENRNWRRETGGRKLEKGKRRMVNGEKDKG
jgi:hypothetical protein